MRIRVDLDDDTRQRVRDYAEENGVRMPRAYAELIKKGLNDE